MMTSTSESSTVVDLPEEIQANVQQFQCSIAKVEEHLQPLIQSQLTPAIYQKLKPLQRVKLNLCVAYTVNSLFYMYLKTQGLDPQNHPIKSELQRVQEYMQKSENDPKQVSINTNVARRMVMNALSKKIHPTTHDRNSKKSVKNAQHKRKLSTTSISDESEDTITTAAEKPSRELEYADDTATATTTTPITPKQKKQKKESHQQ